MSDQIRPWEFWWPAQLLKFFILVTVFLSNIGGMARLIVLLEGPLPSGSAGAMSWFNSGGFYQSKSHTATGTLHHNERIGSFHFSSVGFNDVPEFRVDIYR